MRAGKSVRGIEYDYYRGNLAEPWLLDQALLLEVEANQIPLAVPVGKVRRGGHIEFLERAEAQKALVLLGAEKGFPNPRIVEPMKDYIVLRWGDEPPFDGCDYAEPICGVLLGIYYGYSDAAIADYFRCHMGFPRRHFTKKQIAQLIQSARRSAKKE